MRKNSEEIYQIGTLVVVTLTILTASLYLLIFLNPRIAFNPLKPPRTTTVLAVSPTLAPTWTPTPTDTPTQTATSRPIATPTALPSPSSPPPNTATHTPRPPTRTATLVPPSPTSAPPTAAVPPTPLPPTFSFRPVLQSCAHSGSITIKGRVTSGGQPQDGIHVRLATGPDAASVVEDQLVRRDVDGSTIYAFSLPVGAFSWFVWVADAAGSPLSNTNFRVDINGLPASSPDACWQAVLDFVK